MKLAVDSHPSLDLAAFVVEFAEPLAALQSPSGLQQLLRADADTPFERNEDTRAAVRDMLRHGGYKPTGRGKPASEYLVRAAEASGLMSINVAVDAGNAVSLHTGLPISVVDMGAARAPLRVALAAAGSRYVFNPAGQEIDVSGLLCLHDAAGPCANAVKDAMRTKTSDATTRTLCLIWGAGAARPTAADASAWFRELLAPFAARFEEVE